MAASNGAGVPGKDCFKALVHRCTSNPERTALVSKEELGEEMCKCLSEEDYLI